MSIEKQKLYNEIETLPEELTIQVVNFIEFLKLSYVDGEAPESVTIKSKSNVVIGAGSVVNKDIPSNVVAVGNPCKVLKNI